MIYASVLHLVSTRTAVIAPVQSGGLETAADISLIVMALGSGLLLFGVAVVLLQIRRVLQSLNEQVKPVTERALVAAANVEYISAVVREDIQKVTQSIDDITGRLNEASDHMDDRVQEFNALMEVVQGEAERVFVDTAAAVRGVQAGARSMGRATEPPSEVAPPVERDRLTPLPTEELEENEVEVEADLL